VEKKKKKKKRYDLNTKASPKGQRREGGIHRDFSKG